MPKAVPALPFETHSSPELNVQPSPRVYRYDYGRQ